MYIKQLTTHSSKIFRVANKNKKIYKTNSNNLIIDLFSITRGSFTTFYLKNKCNHNNFKNIIKNKNLNNKIFYKN